MSVLEKFLDAIKMNDDYDDDDDFFDEEDEIEEEKPRRRFFGRKLEEEEDEEEEQPARSSAAGRRASSSSRASASSAASKMPNRPRQQAPQPEASPKVTPMRKRQNMEVCIIKPASMEDTREIADTLLAGCTVILNLEGIDVEVAQRIIDFCCGSSYCLNGGLQKVSGYIFILTPSSVEISGDIQDLLNGAFDIPSIRTDF